MPLDHLNILVVGCGGLGCELAKTLALSGFRRIELVDHDKIALSNLNRQFLFRQSDVGRHKAEVVRECLEAHFYAGAETNASFSSHCCTVQQMDLQAISQFDVVLSAVDSVTARRWINWAVHEAHSRRSQGPASDSQPGAGRRPLLIDGGSQGLYGHVRVVDPFVTGCLECSLGLFSSEAPLPCVVTSLRTPEDCVYHALNLEFDATADESDGTANRLQHASSAADPESMLQRVFQRARRLAEASGVDGVTLDLVDRLCNRSVPNLATTNAIIASLMVNTILNLYNSSSPARSSVDANFFFYTGDGSTGITKLNLEPDHACTVCRSKCIDLKVSQQITLRELLSMLSQRLGSNDLNIVSDETIYLGSSAGLRDAYSHRLDMKLSDFNIVNRKVYVTDSTSPTTWVVFLNF